MSDELSGFSMQELFRLETETQAAVLTEGLLALEKDADSQEPLEALMRAAHSIKGAARLINLEGAVRVAHLMEDCFVAAQKGKLVLLPKNVDTLLGGVDMLTRISNLEEGQADAWFADHLDETNELVEALAAITGGSSREAPAAEGALKTNQPAKQSVAVNTVDEASIREHKTGDKEEAKDGVLRLRSEHLDRMLALASEMQVGWQWLPPFSDAMLQMKRRLGEVENMLFDAELSASGEARVSGGNWRLKEIRAKVQDCRNLLVSRRAELDVHTRDIADLARRLYHQTVNSRMQPFSEGLHGLKRMVRDLARDLGKQVRLEVTGEDASVDRDILEKIKSPLNHLIRNAIDHGIETAEERQQVGKPEEGVIHIEAVHQAGMLRVTVSDDGRGLDLDALRERVADKAYASKEMVSQMTEAELTAFLFLPKFTMRDVVTNISGRGVGLDVVASMVRDVRGTISSSASKGQGMRFELRLPIALSLIRALLVEIAGEPYAFPLVHVHRAVESRVDDIERIEGRQYLTLNDQQIGLVSMREVLDLPQESAGGDSYPVVILGPVESRYGLIVDAFLGERNLVEKPLPASLGKVKDISAAAVTANGSPLLIFDVGDLLVSIAKLVGSGQFGRAGLPVSDRKQRVKRILVVDDSLTVREVERKLLASHGYEVEVAVDGIDGLNSARGGNFDLMIIDVDMPRMDGIELVLQIKRDAKLKDTPIVIVSYKESDEDRMRGLEAGADSYLTKSSFHDDTLLGTVANLIGEAT